jgi:predicted nuclease of predicted toxin-antitoxin system
MTCFGFVHLRPEQDWDVLLLAAQQRRVVLTLDKDFRHLALKSGVGKYGIILFRVHPAVPDKIIPVVLRTLSLGFDWFGHTSVVSESTVQMFVLRVAE